MFTRNLQVFSDNFGPDDKIGRVSISCADIIANPDDPLSWGLLNLSAEHLPEKRHPHWFPLAGRRKRWCGGLVRLTVVFTPVTSQDNDLGLNDCYFSLLKYNHVTLYQDAETPHDPLFDEITYEDGSSYQATNCWRDIYQALCDAQKVIYLTGWSVWTDVVLVRDEGEEQETLGDLLKRKVNYGAYSF